jgi:hypothetical protein
MKTKFWKKLSSNFAFCFIILTVFISLSSITKIPSIHAQGISAFVRQVRTLETDPDGLKHPAGLAYLSRINTFQVVEVRELAQKAPAQTDVISLTPFGHRAGSSRVQAAVQNPINLVYDHQARRMLFLDSQANQLFEILDGSNNMPDPTRIIRHEIKGFGLRNPQGMTVDPVTGDLLILDTVGPRILRISSPTGGSFETAVRSTIDLKATGLMNPRGMALDPSTGHLHLFRPQDQKLVELTQAGAIVAIRDLSIFHLGSPQGLVFAPSGDQTDDPLQMSLYLADSGLETGQNGQVVELSFVELAAPAASPFQSNLIRTTDMAAFLPPSPDPSGIAYIPSRNSLLISDGEVEETVSGITHFAGANIWELSLSGNVIRTANISRVAPTVVPMTNEPTGLAWNPGNNHVYVSDDDAMMVYDLAPGIDGLIGTADDTRTSFSTQPAGSGDPEGITYDSWQNQLFVVDGTNAEVYQYSVSGSLISHFDVQAYGVGDPESVEFNPDTGTLFVMSGTASTKTIIETTTSGALLQTINYSAANPQAAAGLAYAPASDGSGIKRFYIVDRGIDNNTNPNIIDGKMYEMTTPPVITPGNTAPVVNAGPDQTITLPADAVLDGTVSDDGLPNPPGSLTTSWSKISGPGAVTFANANAVDTIATFSMKGVYELCLAASDGELAPSDCMSVTVSSAAGTGTVEVRVTASSDDAEESSSGSVALTSSDLELVYDGSNQTVGMRFKGVAIPAQAIITSAKIQFKVDETNTETTSLTITGEASDNPTTFASTSANITSRKRTTASIAWLPAAWSILAEAGPNQQTPNIAAVIQEIVNRPGWISGSSLVIFVGGSGHRTAIAFDGNPAGAPLLSVEYSARPLNTAPVVAILSPTNGTTFNQGDVVSFIGSANDTQDGDITTGLTWTSSLDGVIGAGGSFTRSNLSVGSHTITAAATDSAGTSGSTQVTLTVNSTLPQNQAPLVNAGPDQTITLPNLAALDGTISDDGLPNPPGLVTAAWSMVSGPGTVNFTNPSAIDTTASFSTTGNYILLLTANDGLLTASDNVTVSVTGSDLIFSDSFETNNLSAWSTSAIDGGNLSVSAAAALVGTRGLQALINDNNSIYVRDNLPNAEARYRLRFYFDPNSIVMARNNAHYIFQGYTASGTVVLRIELRFYNGYQIRANLLNDSSVFTNTAWFAISDAPHFIELDWRAATTTLTHNGGLSIWIDGVQKANLTTIDNDTRRIDSVRLGAVSGIDSGTRGVYYFDDFVSRRQTYIGQ